MQMTATQAIEAYKADLEMKRRADQILRWGKRYKRSVVKSDGRKITMSCDECTRIWHTELNERGNLVSGGLRCINPLCTTNDGFRRRPKAPEADVPRLSADHYR